MAEIKQVLSLEDKFSQTLDTYLKRLEDMQDKLDELSDNQKQFNENSDKLDNTLNRLANGGLERVLRKVSMLAAAFFGINKVKSAVMQSFSDMDTAAKYENRVGGHNLIEYNRGLSLKYGGSAQQFNQSTATMTRYADSSQIERMYNLAARIASINPNMSVAQAANSLASSVENRSGSSLVQSTGLKADVWDRKKLDFALQKGDLNTALAMLDEMTEKAGGTEQALQNMLNTPFMSLQRMYAKFEGVLAKVGKAIAEALQPAIEAVSVLLDSEAFNYFCGIVVGVFSLIGSIISSVILFIVENFDKFIEKIKLVALWTGILMGAFVLAKSAIFAASIIMGAYKGITILATIAQKGLNVAMMANPIGAVVLAVTALIAALLAAAVAITGFVDKSSPPLKRLFGIFAVVGEVVKTSMSNIFGNISNIIKSFVNIIASIVEFFANVFTHPLLAIKHLFVSTFASILDFIGATINPLVETLEKFELTKGIAEKLGGLREFASELRKTVADEQEANGMLSIERKELVDIHIPDYQGAYNKGKEAYDKVAGKINSLTSAIDANSDAITENTQGLQDMSAVFDLDEWKDKFANIMVADMERRAINNVNSPFSSNITINMQDGNSKNIAEKIGTEVKKELEQQAEILKAANYAAGYM